MSDEAPRILIVDPDRRHRRVLEVSLCKVGFEAVGVATGKEAVAYLQTCVPALIMAEIDLPDLSGFELCKRVRSQPSTEEVPIFFLSKSGDMADKLRAFELGVDEFLIRPVYIKEIVARVGLALKRRENERIAEAEAHTITGDLRDVQLIDILQTIEDREKTGALRLERGTIRGTIYFENGQPLDARVGHLTGPQAVFRLFNWTEGQYTLKYITQIRRLRRIDESFTDLVLEGLKQTEDFSEATKEFEDLSACLRLDFSSLAKVLDNMPDQVVELLHLFDGRRTLQQVLDESPMSDLDAIQAIRRLAAQELFQVVAPEVRGEQDDFDSLDADPEAFRVPTFQSWLSGEDPAERARLEEEERRRKEEEQRRRKEEEEQLQQELDELAKLKEVAESQRLQAEAQRRLAEEQARQLDERQRLIRRRLAGELDTKMGRLAPDLSGLPSKVHGFVAEDTIPGVFPHDSLMPAPTLRETEKPKLSVAPSDMEAAFPELKQLRAERDQVESLRNQYEQERRQLRELQGKRRQLEEERLRFQREIEEERALLQREIDAAQKQEFETTLSREADAQQMKELEALRRQEIREAEERALAAQRQEEIEDDVWGQLEQAVEDRLLEDELDAETADEMEQGRDFEEEALAKAQAGLLEARQKYADERRRRELALRRAAQPSADQPTVTDRASLRQSAVEQARQRLIEPDEPAPEEKPTRKRIPTHPQQMEAIQEPIALADTPESLPSIPQASLGKYAKARKREQGPPVGLSSAEIPASRAVQQQQALRPEPIRIIGESEPP
ncbi:MAG: response regulator, partial [Actinobacteria bacterium]|nr:response regulator [Actinomycetota bacterium]MBU1495146.1 response regulator [Actinomycetota bacterium]